MREVWSFYSAGRIVFGRNAVRQLGEVAEQIGARRCLIVTDAVLVGAGVVERVAAPLREAGLGVDVFSGGGPEPSFAMVDACVAQAREFCPDALIGLGGGSNMDLAKISAVLLTHGGSPRDYVGDGVVPGPIMPVIAIPTTAGTGSEVSAASVLKDEERDAKVGVLSNYLRPRAAVCDPLLTVSCPPKVTADSGIDALTHAIEAYTAVPNETFPLPEGERTVYQGTHPMGDLFAEKAISLIGANLRAAVVDSGNLEAREAMHLGSLFAGLAFSNVGVAVVHALEFPLGAAAHTSHGAGNGLLLPYVMAFNRPARAERFAAVARLLGAKTEGIPIEEAGCLGIDAVQRLKRDIGIPMHLRDVGITEAQLPALAEAALAFKRLQRVNPRPVTQEDLHSILQSAL